MTIKLFILLATYVLLVRGDDVESKENVESYITKEAAKELRNKLSARGMQQDRDYDEILQRIIMSVQQPSEDKAGKQIVFEKKYFDYLPNDLDSEDVTDEDATRELEKSFEDASPKHETVQQNARRVNSRKFKRDLTAQSRDRRQSIHYVPLYQYSPNSNVDFYHQPDIPGFPSSYPVAPQSRFGENTNYDRKINTWSSQNPSKVYPPGNFYLPSKPGNYPSPPHNPRPGDTDFNNRGFFEEDDKDQRIWSIVSKVSPVGKGGSSSSAQSFSKVFPTQSFAPTPRPITQRPVTRPTTQRPPATTTRPSGINNNAVYNSVDGDPSLGIEYPPDIFDDDEPLTTRAPLVRPRTTRRPDSRAPARVPATVQPLPTAAARVYPTPNRNQVTGREKNQKVPTCVQAVVNCCSRYDDQVRAPCFEKYQCTPFFWGRSPCSPEIKAAAFREVEKFSK